MNVFIVAKYSQTIIVSWELYSGYTLRTTQIVWFCCDINYIWLFDNRFSYKLFLNIYILTFNPSILPEKSLERRTLYYVSFLFSSSKTNLYVSFSSNCVEVSHTRSVIYIGISLLTDENVQIRISAIMFLLYDFSKSTSLDLKRLYHLCEVYTIVCGTFIYYLMLLEPQLFQLWVYHL